MAYGDRPDEDLNILDVSPGHLLMSLWEGAFRPDKDPLTLSDGWDELGPTWWLLQYVDTAQQTFLSEYGKELDDIRARCKSLSDSTSPDCRVEVAIVTSGIDSATSNLLT
jgi:hypothetical protein